MAFQGSSSQKSFLSSKIENKLLDTINSSFSMYGNSVWWALMSLQLEVIVLLGLQVSCLGSFLS